MAVADIAGPLGSAVLTGVTAHFAEWSATANITNEDTTGFADGGYETNVNTCVGISGSITATVQSGAAGANPWPGVGATLTLASLGPISIVLTAFTGCTYTFNANLTSIPITRPVKGKMTVSFSYKSTGAITAAWA